MNCRPRYVEVDLHVDPDEWDGWEVIRVQGTVYPDDPGRLWGHPDDRYPPEPGCVEVDAVCMEAEGSAHWLSPDEIDAVSRRYGHEAIETALREGARRDPWEDGP